MSSPLALNASKHSLKTAFWISISALIASVGNAQVNNPVPDIPEPSGITLKIESFVQIPTSSGSAPLARINHLKPMHDAAGRLMVNDLNGPLHVIDGQQVTLYLDLDTEVPAFTTTPGLGTGFGSFDFHPDFANNGKFYTAHSEGPGSGTADFTRPVNSPVALQGVVTEWTATDPAATTFSGTSREIMRVDLVHTIHGMQEISFNPNSVSTDDDFGYLYICIGDGGTTIEGYPGNTQVLNSVLGTILRIDTAGNNSPNGQYGVPADNPFADDGDPDTFDEIWAYGFRNPHRISWDTAGDGKMLSGDIGEKQIEELNLIEPGNNYGWNVREGTFRINPNFENDPNSGDREEVFELPANDAELGYTYPVAQFGHHVGAAIVSGYVYRGSDLPAMAGKFIFGDIKFGDLWIVDADSLSQGTQSDIEVLNLELDGQPTTMFELAGNNNRADIRFGIDDDQELYLLEKRKGMIYKVVEAVDENNNGGRDPASGGKLVNLSTRSQVGTGDDVLIGGFVIGHNSRKVLIQAIGPELTNNGVTGALADPVLEVFDAGNASLGTNDDWEDDAESATTIRDLWGGALPFADGSTSSGIILMLNQGSYTAVISGKGDTTGVALIEVYEVE
jgi:glucose/arabinose dehydrogenase